MKKYRLILILLMLCVLTESVLLYRQTVQNPKSNRIFLSESMGAVSTISIEEIDALLRAANTPETEIDTMSDELKLMIYENTLSQTEAEYVPVVKEASTGDLIGDMYIIPESELQLSVSAFKLANTEQIDIYPCYEWLVPVQPKGKDWFGYSTHDSYSCVSGKRSNLIWYKRNKDVTWTRSEEAAYTGSSMTGLSGITALVWEHRIPSFI